MPSYAGPDTKPEPTTVELTPDAQRWAYGLPTVQPAHRFAKIDTGVQSSYSYVVSDTHVRSELLARKRRTARNGDSSYPRLNGLHDAMQWLDTAPGMVPKQTPKTDAPEPAPDANQAGWNPIMRAYFQAPQNNIMESLTRYGHNAQAVHAAHLVHNVQNKMVCDSKWVRPYYTHWYPLDRCAADGDPYVSADKSAERAMIASDRPHTKEMQVWGCASCCQIERVRANI